MQKGPTPSFVIYLIRVFIFFRLNNYVSLPKRCNLYFSHFYLLSLFFCQIGSGLILAMWTRAICNSLRFTFPQILTVNKSMKECMALKIKSSVDHNEHDKTNINENDTQFAHTTPRVRLTVALPRKVIVE